MVRENSSRIRHLFFRSYTTFELNSWASDQWQWNRGAIINYYATADLSCQTNECRANSGPDNNGNVRQSQYWIPTNDQISGYNWTEDRFSYDSLNRLESVSEYHGTHTSGLSGQDFKQAYSYDRFGNRTINQSLTSPTIPHPNYTADPANNRLIAPAGYSYAYDAAGNQTTDNYTGAGSRTYDGENHLKTAQGYPNNQWQTYTYDAGGRRIKRNVNGVETWQVYGMGGELLAEYKSGAAPFLPSREYGYRGGQLLVTMSSGDDARLARFVTNLYYGAKQTDPTPQQLQDAVNQLAAAGATSQAQLLTVARQIARALFTGTNYETNAPARTDAQYVADLYSAYLQRGPDDSGLGWWTGQVASSGRANVCNAFEGSSEFITLVSTLYGTAASDNERTEHLVNNFYLGAYGRNATPTELQQQRDALNAAAAQGLSQVQAQAETFGRSLFAAQVNDAGLSNTQFVTNLYEGFLQRGPDAGGLGFWSGQATVGTGRQNVLNQFATCGGFRELAGTLYREAFWLVADHLGTPRMIVGKSGTLASVKRHDYLPFGEELSAPMSGRTTTQGYTGDSVRQHFTGYEADGETGLNFAQARYQSTLQGRFTSVDPLGASASVGDPQSFNRYSYVNNNPLNFVDPTGMSLQDIGIVQTTDESYARTMQGSSDSAFKRDVNKDAAARADIGAGIAGAVGGAVSGALARSAAAAPVIPPFDSEIEGSPLYQEQMALAPRPNVSVDAGPTEARGNIVLPNGEGFMTGVVSIFNIRVTDEAGRPMAGLIITESNVTQDDINSLTTIENPMAITTDASGTFPDIVSGNATKSNYRLSDREQTRAVQKQIESRVSVTTTQTLTIAAPGYGLLGTAVYKRTFTNMSGQNRLPAFDSAGRHINNFRAYPSSAVTMSYP